MADGGLLGNIKARFGRGRPAPQITRDQALRALPIRNPSLEWRENDDAQVVVTLPRRDDLTGKALSWVFFVPESKPVALDDVGTFVWLRCDGEHSLKDIVQELCDEYKLGRRETEVSLIEYMKMLGKRGMIGFAIPKDLADEIGDAATFFGAAGSIAPESEPGEAEAEDDEPAEQE